MKQSSDLVTVATEIRELGAIIGRGLFAREHIAAGDVIAVFGGTALPGPAFRDLDDELRSWSVQVSDDIYLVPSGGANPASMINHSCDPTCRMAGEITLVAARDLEPGDALTYDYATTDASPYDEFECECGTAICRGKVTGQDWMLPQLQQRYAGWFSPYLQRKIDAIHATAPSDRTGLTHDH
ncbi:MAG: SET domain-containing methyltransferase [Actinomycetota bacterium]